MNMIHETEEFSNWLKALRDMRAKARILARLKMAGSGNFGDHKSVGDGVSEMRVDVGPGYRLYYTKIGKVVYLLLCGGDKSSQDRDIVKAKSIAKELET